MSWPWLKGSAMSLKPRVKAVFLDRVAAIAGAAHAVERLVDHVATRLDAGKPAPVEAYVACKVAGPEWLWRAADDLVQFLGGRGYVEPNLAPQILRDARVTRILEGPTEALTMFLGSRVANDPEASADPALIAAQRRAVRAVLADEHVLALVHSKPEARDHERASLVHARRVGHGCDSERRERAESEAKAFSSAS